MSPSKEVVSPLKKFLVSSRIITNVMRSQGFPMNSQRYLPAIQSYASSEDPAEVAAAFTLTNIYKTANEVNYNAQRHGVTHAVSNLMAPKPPPSSKNVDGTVGRVAFVLTQQTRQTLRNLGHADDSIRSLRPAEALAIAEAAVAPCDLDAFVVSMRQPSNQTSPQAILPPLNAQDAQSSPSENSCRSSVDPLDQREESFNMSAAIAELRMKLKAEAEADKVKKNRLVR